MITIKTESLIIELYSSIKELPITRYKLMQQYLIQDSGIGSSITDIDTHLSKTILLLQNSKLEEAKEELANLRYNFFSILSGLDFKCRAFSCLIKTINGESVSDFSPEGLTKITDKISILTTEDVSDNWEKVKKKLILNLEPISLDGSEMTLNTLTT
jgi:hypothetical protein